MRTMSISQRVILNRRMLFICNKLLKNFCLENEVENEEKLFTILDRGVRTLFEFYKFLSTYNLKILPNEKNKAVLSDVSFLSSEDDEDKLENKDQKQPTIELKNTTYNIPKQFYERYKKQYATKRDKITYNNILEMLKKN